MKTQLKLISITLIIILISFIPNLAGAMQPPQIEAEAAIVIDQRSGTILFAKDAQRRMFPASTTKILTALLAVETGDLAEIVTVGTEINLVQKDSSLAHLKFGDTISLGDLIYGLMLPSGNDAAYIIAVHLGRRQAGIPDLSPAAALDVFVQKMNARALDLGAKDSHFTVPDGYHDENHYTTAYDLSLIAREAMTHPFIRAVVFTNMHRAQSWTGSKIRDWKNNNLLIQADNDNYYPYATGLKTGYTEEAGFCLVSSGSYGDMDLIAVSLNSSRDRRWPDARALLAYGFANYTWQQLLHADEIIQTVNISNGDYGQPDSVALTAAEGFAGVFAQEDLERIKKQVIIDSSLIAAEKAPAKSPASGFSLCAPLVKGQTVGRVLLTLDGRELFSTDLVATQNVAAQPWWRKLLTPAILLLAACLFSVPAICIYKSKRRRKSDLMRRRRSI
mgnify:CR=1 FL=1|jgi:D-alanyl-D-alanine carboxypeptidase (penicillin-binding protein 5/6)